MRTVLVVVALAAGCGRVAFEPSRDAPVDSVSAPAGCDWREGPQLTGPPVFHGELSSTTFETDPVLWPGDPLTMYFVSQRLGTSDVFVARRAAIGVPFDPPTAVSQLSSPSVDELGIIFATDPLNPGVLAFGGLRSPAAMSDLYAISGPASATPFARTPITELNTPDAEYDPWPSPDGRRMMFARGDGLDLDLFETRRATPEDPWEAPTPFAWNRSNSNDSSATLTADQRTIVWSALGVQDLDLFYAVRDSADAPWGAPQLLSVSAAVGDFEPAIREDGCELFWVQATTGLNWDIYSVRIER